MKQVCGCLPGRHPVSLHVWRHLHSDPGSIVEVLQHVVALRVFDHPAEGFLQGEPARSSVRVVEGGSLSPACGSDTDTGGVSSGEMQVSVIYLLFWWAREHLPIHTVLLLG